VDKHHILAARHYNKVFFNKQGNRFAESQKPQMVPRHVAGYFKKFGINNLRFQKKNWKKFKI
jgi:hypothetical protein